MLKKLSAFLLISNEKLSENSPDIWRTSVLRIVSLSVIILIFAILVHSSISAYKVQAYFVFVLNGLFLGFCLAMILFPAKRYFFGAHTLLFAVVAAAFCIYFFVRDFQIAKIGILMLYTLPIFARIFFGSKTAVVFMLLNFSGFIILCMDIESPDFLSIGRTLEHADIYINGVIFLFFNICIPLGVFRVLHTLELSGRQYSKLNEELEKNKEVYREVFENKGNASLICETNNRIVKANSDFYRFTGYSQEEVLGQNINRFVDTSPFLSFENHKSWKCRLICSNSKDISCIAHYSVLSSQERYIISFIDITAQTKAEQALLKYENKKQFLQYYDSLTELPNREYLLIKLRKHTFFVLTNNQLYACICISPSHFNYIEQKHGSVIGNILLKRLGSIFDNLCCEHFCTAKLRGLSFCFVTKSFSSLNELKESVIDISKKLPSSVNISGIEIELSFYMGVSVCPKDSSQAEESIKNAELARDYAKSTFSTKPIFYDASLNTQKVEQIEIELITRKALENDRFYLVYQPKVDHKGTIVSAEALVRMQSDNDAGALSPGLFIPVAEKSGLITKIEEKIIHMTFSFLSSRINSGKKMVPVSINISGRNIGNMDFASNFLALLKQYEIPHQYIEIEITETALMIAQELAQKNLERLKKEGIMIHIDDFGTGYSSLGKLIDLPVDTLKIDKSFLDKTPDNIKHVSLIKTIINLAKQLNLKVIAEGVETKEQRDLLIRSGCNEFQGYYFYRPLSTMHFERLLDSSSLTSNKKVISLS
jgi:PAS domain S-box-containing protein